MVWPDIPPHDHRNRSGHHLQIAVEARARGKHEDMESRIIGSCLLWEALDTSQVRWVLKAVAQQVVGCQCHSKDRCLPPLRQANAAADAATVVQGIQQPPAAAAVDAES